MAKGNDGNYLQHGLEVAAAAQLSRSGSTDGLYVALCHGMAPFEKCDDPRPGQARALLSAALRESCNPPRPNEPPLVTAYRTTGATLSRYPNSAELLRTLVGTDRLHGLIAEVDPDKYKQLSAAWLGSRLRVSNASWRAELGSGKLLEHWAERQMPWLVTLDPMTYREEGEADDSNVYRADLPRLTSVVQRLTDSGMPGAAIVFVYAMRPAVRAAFWRFADGLAASAKVTLTPFWLTHQGGNHNLAAFFSSGFSFANECVPRGLIVGRD